MCKCEPQKTCWLSPDPIFVRIRGGGLEYRNSMSKTENTSLVIYVLLHWNDFNILNLSHITSRLTTQVKTIWFNLKVVLNFLNFFELVLKLSYGFGQSSLSYRRLSYRKACIIIKITNTPFVALCGLLTCQSIQKDSDHFYDRPCKIMIRFIHKILMTLYLKKV